MIYNIVTVKFGNKYTSDFVNKLYRDIGYFSRGYYISGRFKFYCYTDNPEGLIPGIEVIDARYDPTLKAFGIKYDFLILLCPLNLAIIFT